MAKENYLPEGFHPLTPMLAIRHADQAIEWYKKALNATELYRLTEPDGRIAHAELRISNAIFMIAEENPDYNKSPDTLGGTSIILNVYVPDVDSLIDLAVQQGAKIIFPVQDQFYGDRAGRIKDPFGHMWIISTHLKNVKPSEMQEQMSSTLN
jgi:PhnB protein